MLNNGEISLTAVDSSEKYPDLSSMINQLTKAHNKQAEQGEIKASGICWNAKVSLENGAQSDAVIVSLEHIDNYSVIIGQPYKLGFLKKLHTGSIFAHKGKHDIFL